MVSGKLVKVLKKTRSVMISVEENDDNIPLKDGILFLNLSKIKKVKIMETNEEFTPKMFFMGTDNTSGLSFDNNDDDTKAPYYPFKRSTISWTTQDSILYIHQEPKYEFLFL